MNKIVVHTAVGRIVKGQTSDFSPMKESFHLQTLDRPDQVMEVQLRNLKAVFFVKDFAGNPDYREAKDFSRAPAYGKRVKITFQDGEVFHGIADNVRRDRVGFFIMPADPGVNTIRAFVLNESIAHIEEV
jgi:hypothetical protein